MGFDPREIIRREDEGHEIGNCQLYLFVVSYKKVIRIISFLDEGGEVSSLGAVEVFYTGDEILGESYVLRYGLWYYVASHEGLK